MDTILKDKPTIEVPGNTERERDGESDSGNHNIDIPARKRPPLKPSQTLDNASNFHSIEYEPSIVHT